MNILLNLVLFQLGWVATVAGAGNGMWWAGPLSLVVLAVVTFRLSNMRAGEVNRRLEELIARFANDLEEGALISVTDQNIRVRRLPAI